MKRFDDEVIHSYLNSSNVCPPSTNDDCTNYESHEKQVHFEDHSRSYDPYLISYHQDSNTFTYNDPWISNDQSNDNSNNCNDISNEFVCDNGCTNEPQTQETPYVHNDWQSDHIEQNYHCPHAPIETSTPAFTACDTINNNNNECHQNLHEQQQQQSNSVEYHSNPIRCDDVSPSSSNLNNVRNVEHVSHEVSSLESAESKKKVNK